MSKYKLSKFGDFPFIFVLFAITLGLYVFGSSFIPLWDLPNPYFEGASNAGIISFYALLISSYLLFALVYIKRETLSYLAIPIKRGLIGFVIGMVSTILIMNALIYFHILTVPVFNQPYLLVMLVMEICVVALSEEIIFRGFFLDLLGIFGSSIIFALYHSLAYGFIWYNFSDYPTYDWGSLIVAFSLGLLFAMIVESSKTESKSINRIKSKLGIKKKFKITLGIPCTIGIHAAYNLCLIGVFYFGGIK